MVGGLTRGLRSVIWSLGLKRIAARSQWRARRLLILCYHGISLDDEHAWNPELFIPERTLRSRFSSLERRGASVLPLAEALERLKAGDLPPLAVALTFDDGGYDFRTKAQPALRDFGFPATVYLTTYYCLNQRLVFDPACAYVLWKASRLGLVGVRLPGIDSIPIQGRAQRRSAVAMIRHAASSGAWDADQKDDFLSEVASATGLDLDAIRARRILHIMTPDEVRGLDPNIDVQLHTHRHRAPRERAAFLREIEENRAVISELRPSAPSPTHFCYPSGVVDSVYLPWLREAGVHSATTCEPGLAGPEAEALSLPRFVDTSAGSDSAFDAWVAGAGEWASARFWRLGTRTARTVDPRRA